MLASSNCYAVVLYEFSTAYSPVANYEMRLMHIRVHRSMRANGCIT